MQPERLHRRSCDICACEAAAHVPGTNPPGAAGPAYDERDGEFVMCFTDTAAPHS